MFTKKFRKYSKSTTGTLWQQLNVNKSLGKILFYPRAERASNLRHWGVDWSKCLKQSFSVSLLPTLPPFECHCIPMCYCSNGSQVFKMCSCSQLRLCGELPHLVMSHVATRWGQKQAIPTLAPLGYTQRVQKINFGLLLFLRFS